MRPAILALALIFYTALPASAYRYSCSQWVNDNHSSQEGHVAGVTDMLAGLLCFGGDDRCACVQDAWSHAQSAAAAEVSNCAGGNDGDAWGRIYDATLGACPQGSAGGGTLPGEYSQTCDQWQDDMGHPDQTRPRAARGFYWGVTDMLAGLLCFVGDDRCECLSNASRDESFATWVESELWRCDGQLPAYGAAYIAALDFCESPGPVCGNGIREDGEECDGADLGSATCQSLGYTTGSLACASNCTHVADGCSNGDGETPLCIPPTLVEFCSREESELGQKACSCLFGPCSVYGRECDVVGNNCRDNRSDPNCSLCYETCYREAEGCRYCVPGNIYTPSSIPIDGEISCGTPTYGPRNGCVLGGP